MKIITLNNDDLENCCLSLCQQVKTSNFIPDLILGIESGGKPIAEKIHRFLGLNDCELKFCQPVKKNRSDKGKLKVILKHMPLWALNLLRILEAKMLFNSKLRNDIKEIILPPDIDEFKNILLVDDAVDSGSTIKKIIEEISEKGNAHIKSAVLTVTGKNPLILPDFYLFHNDTLIRFPWSIDAKK